MKKKLFIDNWTLYEIGKCLIEGLSNAEVENISFNKKSGKYEWIRFLRSNVQLDALFSVLVEIVLNDELFIEQSLTKEWKSQGTYFDCLEQSKILKFYRFEHENENILKKSGRIFDLLTLKDKESENQDNLIFYDISFLRVAFTRTSRYLALSDELKMPYSPHPNRSNILGQTTCDIPHTNVVDGTIDWIQKERTKLFSKITTSIDRRCVNTILPPIIIEVIEESNSFEDLIPTAIQLREKYKKLRSWLAQYQLAFDDEDPQALIKHKKILDSVSKNIERNYSGNTKYGKTDVTVSTGWLQMPISVRYVIVSLASI